jgi:chromosomal replication initiation ATPase DnaA
MISIAEIQHATAAAYGLTRDELLGPRLARRYAWPRQIAMALGRELTNQSYTQIGRNFGRDHTTVLRGIRQLAKRADKSEQRKMKAIRAKLRADEGACSRVLAQRQAAMVLEWLAAFLRERPERSLVPDADHERLVA